jgi:hypothetical protein
VILSGGSDEALLRIERNRSAVGFRL